MIRSTADCHSTQTPQFSRQSLNDGVHNQTPLGHSRQADLATHPGGWNGRVGRPTRFHITPGRSWWGPWLGSNRGTDDVWNWTNESQVLSLLCWDPRYRCRCWLEFIDPPEHTANGIVQRNEGFLHLLRYARGVSWVWDSWSKGA